MNVPDLVAAIAEAAPEELPALVLAVAARLAQVGGSMAALSPPHGNDRDRQEQEAERLLTPEEAARIAQVPVSRIYRWARTARWASRPTRRCLRIAEHGFRRWLATRT